MRPLACVLVLLALAGCAGTKVATRPTVTCDERKVLPIELLEPGSVILFGEMHGTRELPAFFGEAVCAAAASGRSIEVGLEQPSTGQPAVDAFLASAGGEAALAPVLEAEFWHRDTQDGRSSRAKVDLLERLRGLRARGLPVSVFLFDPWPQDKKSPRDEEMARRIFARARAHPGAVTLVLVGEVHAWTAIGAPWNPEFRPMGWFLSQDGVRVRSLGRATPAGTAWICTGGTASDCGQRDMPATRDRLPSGGTDGVELLPALSERGYVGFWATPTLTASPPATL